MAWKTKTQIQKGTIEGGMPTSSGTVSKTNAIADKGTAGEEEYFTYVEGVGSIPRDIFKYV